MKYLLVFVSVVNLLILCPRGEDDFSGDDDIEDENLSANNKILVHNTFHLSKMNLEQMPKTEIIEEGGQIQDNSNVRNTIHNQHNYLVNHMRSVESRIDILMKTNKNVVNMMNELEMKLNHILNSINTENRKSSSRVNEDQVDLHDVMKKLNIIHEHVASSSKTNCQTKCSDLIGPAQMQLIQNFIAAIGCGVRNRRNFASLSQVLETSHKSLKFLEKFVNTLQAIDERTIQLHDISSRQIRKVISQCKLNENNFFSEDGSLTANKRAISKKRVANFGNESLALKSDPAINTKRLKNGNLYESTYQSKRKDKTRVLYEPKKYNCHDLKVRRSGVYKFSSMDEVPNDAGRFFHERYCDFNTDGVAWTVIQRRFENEHQLNFNRSWLEYKYGFGELDGEFWFGNDFIHKLTFDEDMELRIILEDLNGRQEWAEYSLFKVDSEEYNYNLMIGGYRGSIADSFLFPNDQDFSTYDRQNDNNEKFSCASGYGSGWWFNNCTELYNRNYKGIVWENLLGKQFLKSSKMMIRPKDLWTDDGNSQHRGEYIYTSSSTDP